MMKQNDKKLAKDMILLCSDTIGIETVQKGIRALFRHFGGQIIYIPIRKDTGENAKRILKVLVAVVGNKHAKKIFEKIMFRFGGLQIYIPLERHAFRNNIALEIYEQNYSHGVPINDLAREYRISFNLAYTLWKEGQHEKFNI
jgi:Mor family transcriptional regulator